jgi:hypothetical protein
MKRVLSALVVMIVIAAWGPATAGASGSPQCGTVAFAPQSDDGAFHIAARSTTCSTARNVASASRPSRFRDRDSSYSADGFSCAGRTEDFGGSGKQMVRFRCVRQHSAVSFLRG